MNTFVVPDGMPRAVFQNKYARKKDDGTHETWEEVADRVAFGNLSVLGEVDPTEFERLRAAIASGVAPTSGRHLQQGDAQQPHKLMESFTNCSTAMASFLEFWLLMKGSGVSRLYDADMCRVNWDNMPNTRFVLEGPDQWDMGGHPDYQDWIENARDARHKYDSESEDVRWFTVEDSAEGWVKVVEVLETAAWQCKHKDKLFIFDFSQVRAKGTPIKGQQNRPASGPVPLIQALLQVAGIKGAGMRPWKQAMFVDHYLAACVAVGGVRRAARLAAKTWRDRDVFEFIDIKRGGFLRTANNSVVLDEEFWEHAKSPKPSHARRVFEAMLSSGYFDGTGEPGFVNAHLISWDSTGVSDLHIDTLFGKEVADRLSMHPRTMEMLGYTLEVAKKKRYPFLPNPCQPGFATVLTPEGIRTFDDIDVGSVIWSGKRWTKVINKVATGTKPVYRYRTTAGAFVGTENHRVVEKGVKIEVAHAKGIDACRGELPSADDVLDLQDVMDGWVLGDGSVHAASNNLVYLCVGRGDGCIHEELGALVTRPRDGIKPGVWEVSTTVTSEELPLTYDRQVPTRFLQGGSTKIRGFLRGLYAANGSVCGGRVTLKAASFHVICAVQEMLSSIGIQSYYTTNRAHPVTFSNGTYMCKESYDLNITGQHRELFRQLIGFVHAGKQERLDEAIRVTTKHPKPTSTFAIKSRELLGDFPVYDITVEADEHTYWTGGTLVSNCGEIVLACWGAYCVIADICLANAQDRQEVVEAGREMAKFLVRANQMPTLYAAEVKRTNRIGVSLTGIHEFAYTQFGHTWNDLVNENSAIWGFLDNVRQEIQDAAYEYSDQLGVTRPHTLTTIKPSGTVGKVMNCTEGAHLPAYGHYLRWVQYSIGSADLLDLQARGYPVKDVSASYPGHVVVGFPTELPIGKLMGTDLVVAGDATPEEQYKWLQNIEKFWLGARGNQVSYTLKYNPKKVPFEQFTWMMLEYQSTVRCCSVMAQDDDYSAYAYVPEERINATQYAELMSKIDSVQVEAYDEDALSCAGGACPIERDL